MRKREKGVLTVEASIVLTLLTLFVLFLFSFIRVYRAENMVSHATLQAVDAMALESYLRENALDEKANDVVFLANRLTGDSGLSAASFESLRSANVADIAREKFIAAISNNETNADGILTDFGVKDGLDGVDFSASTVDLYHDDVILNVRYTLEMQFPIFGATEIEVTKSAKAKTFGEILFEISAQAENPNMGSTNGSGHYQHGSNVRITANPNYGYKFVKWSDGNTDSSRTISVTDAQTFVAVFEPDSFGINTEVDPQGTGTATGGGTYTYLSSADLTAKENPGYHFEKWSVYKHKDESTSFVAMPSVTQTVDQSYTYTAYFEPNPYTISVEYECELGTPSVSVYESSNSTNKGKSISVLFGKRVTLTASPVEGNRFMGWRIKGSNPIFSTGLTVEVPVPINGATYVAVYEANLSISLAAGTTQKHSMVFTATTTPSNAEVEWNFSGNQNYYTLSISYDTHTATLTINDSRIPITSLSVNSREEVYNDHKNIYGTVYNDVKVTASIRNYATYKDSRTVRIEPTTQVFYYMYRKNSEANRGPYRHYYDYELKNPWSEYSKGPGYFYRVWSVKYSEFVNAKTTRSKERYYGDQGGKNEALIDARQIWCPKKLVGGYDLTVLAYQYGSIKGESKGNGYYDYYYSEVRK